jgi:hypothetical protein
MMTLLSPEVLLALRVVVVILDGAVAAESCVPYHIPDALRLAVLSVMGKLGDPLNLCSLGAGQDSSTNSQRRPWVGPAELRNIHVERVQPERIDLRVAVVVRDARAHAS